MTMEVCFIPLTKEQQDLVEKNHNLIYWFAQKQNLDIDSYYDILANGLIKAALKYNCNKGSFSNFACCCMKTQLLDFRRKRKDSCNLSECITYDPGIADNVIDKIRYEKFISGLSKKERAVLQSVLDGYSLNETSDRISVSRNSIPRIINRIRCKFLRFSAQ